MMITIRYIIIEGRTYYCDLIVTLIESVMRAVLAYIEHFAILKAPNQTNDQRKEENGQIEFDRQYELRFFPLACPS